ncbi:MAG TPA: DUF1684 domain-containing protein [Candidatus Eisenbacteria bacterium]|nr:DUF1684 domain-containing protein [Candidatus Eisenbacteria bacterium]
MGSRTTVAVAIAGSCLVLFTAPSPAATSASASATPDSLVAAIQKERADTEKWLQTSPTSYLAAVRRVDFDDKQELTVGSAPGNDVRLEDSTVAARHLRVRVVGDSFQVAALDEKATFQIGETPSRHAMLAPRNIGVGRYVVRLSHQRYPALIAFDPRSSRLSEYKGLQYYPVDLRYRFVLPLIPNPRPDTVVIQSTRGNSRRAVRAGWFDFKVSGKSCRLEATRLLEPGVGENDMGIFFRDATTGKETYAVGRYLDPDRLPDGRYVLDFNRAYNPACAFSDYYNCPIPPKANALKVAIRAGEKDSHYLTH